MTNDMLNNIQKHNELSENKFINKRLSSKFKEEYEFSMLSLIIIAIVTVFYFFVIDNLIKGAQATLSYILLGCFTFMFHNSVFFYKRVNNHAKKIRTEEFESKSFGFFIFFFAPFLVIIVLLMIALIIELLFSTNVRDLIIFSYFSSLVILLISSGFYFFTEIKKVKNDLSSYDKKYDSEIESLEIKIKNEINSIEVSEYYLSLDNPYINYNLKNIIINTRNELIKEQGFTNIQEYKLSLVHEVKLENV